MQIENQLKQRTFTGVLWSISDQIASQAIQFIVQIILTRILLPEYFGLIGMILVFILICNVIVDSGFSQALIREQNVSQEDYSTVFWFSLIMSLFLYVILFILTPIISQFFNEPQLVLILRIFSLGLIINSLSIIQRTILTKKLDFGTQTKINIIAVVLSGTVAIIFALRGFGVWSLVVKTLLLQFFQLVLLWFINDWRPRLVFKYESFKRLFGFGSKLMLSGLISIIYSNIYNVIIGKLYSVSRLGYYTNAVILSEVASLSITTALQRVTYPVLSSFQDEKERLKYGFKKIIRITAFINFPLMVGLASVAEPLINFLFGEKWEPMITYFQLLCIAGMFYPLHAVDLNILQVKGKSNLFLGLSIGRKLTLTVLIIGAVWLNTGIIGLITVAVVQAHIEFIIISFYGGREISYTVIEHIKDICVFYIISLFMGVIVYFVGIFIPLNNLITILLQIIVGVVVYIGICRLLKIHELFFISRLLCPIIKSFLTKGKEKLRDES